MSNQRRDHRYAFFVAMPPDSTAFVSDLAGLDPKCYHNDARLCVANVYEWLRNVVKPNELLNWQSIAEMKKK
jgi:hypothetical protein